MTTIRAKNTPKPIMQEEPHHDHGRLLVGTTDNQDPLAALMEQYVHSHDNAETNTFHEQSTRSLLKMALEQMWQSELHLRLYEPEKALPFEQKALKYLKLSQQKARSYVKKTGFDPPQTKEKETRLTGELKNVTTAFNQERMYTQQRIELLVAEALGYLDLPKLTAQQRQTASAAWQCVGKQRSEQRASELVDAGIAAKTSRGQITDQRGKNAVENKTLYALTGTSERTGPSYASDRALQQAFWRHMK